MIGDGVWGVFTSECIGKAMDAPAVCLRLPPLCRGVVHRGKEVMFKGNVGNLFCWPVALGPLPIANCDVSDWQTLWY